MTASRHELLPAKSARMRTEASTVLGFSANAALNMSLAWQEPYVASVLDALTENRAAT